MLGNILVTHQTGPQGQMVSKVFIAECLDIQKKYYFAILLQGKYGGPGLWLPPCVAKYIWPKQRNLTWMFFLSSDGRFSKRWRWYWDRRPREPRRHLHSTYSFEDRLDQRKRLGFCNKAWLQGFVFIGLFVRLLSILQTWSSCRLDRLLPAADRSVSTRHLMLRKLPIRWPNYISWWWRNMPRWLILTHCFLSDVPIASPPTLCMFPNLVQVP